MFRGIASSMLLGAAMFCVDASAIPITASFEGTIVGFHNNAEVNFPTLKKNDKFSFVFTYDSDAFTLFDYYANGVNYVIENYQLEMVGGSGSLYELELSRGVRYAYLDITTRPRNVIHNKQWNIGNILLITEFPNTGSPGYGWINYGKTDSASISTGLVTYRESNVPEPSTLALALLGLFGTASLAANRKRVFRAHPALAR